MNTPRIEWFDASMRSNGERLDGVIADACDLLHLAADPNSGEDRKRRKRFTEKKRQVGAVVASLLKAHLRGRRCLKIRFDEAYYKAAGNAPYRHPRVETRTFARLLSEMQRVGIIKRIQRGNIGKGVSQIEMGPWLAERLRGEAWSFADIANDAEGPTIILNGEKPTRYGKEAAPRGSRLPYKRTSITVAMERRVRAINDALRELDIGIYGDGARDGQPLPWDPDQRWLYRVFTHGREQFDHHGRLYGGFWISMPKAERWRLAIDGERLVQLDFSGMFLSLLYARAGAHAPTNPYDIESVIAAFQSLGSTRQDAEFKARRAVKTFLNARLFDRGDRRSYPKQSPDDPTDLWPRPILGAREFAAALAGGHPLIADHVGSATGEKQPIGHELFLTESEIMLSTLENCLAEDIPALPVHDAILVKRSDYRRAVRIMSDAFEDYVQATPTIKATLLTDPFEGLFLGAAGLLAAEGVFRSRENEPQLEWERGHTLPVPAQYQLRGGEPEIANAVGRAYVRYRSAFLTFLPKGGTFEPTSLLGALIAALASAELWLCDRCSFDESEEEDRRALVEVISGAVNQCIRVGVMRLQRAQLKELVEELKVVDLLPAGFVLPTSQWSKDAPEIA